MFFKILLDFTKYRKIPLYLAVIVGAVLSYYMSHTLNLSRVILYKYIHYVTEYLCDWCLFAFDKTKPMPQTKEEHGNRYPLILSDYSLHNRNVR